MAHRKQSKNRQIVNFEGVRMPICYIKPDKKGKYLGLCYNPKGNMPIILVHPDLLPRKKLNVLIEEVFHAYFFDLPEWKAQKFAKNLGRVIYSDFIKKGAEHARSTI